MADIASGIRLIDASPLTHEVFAPFGEVVTYAGSERRRYLTQPFEHTPEAERPALWTTRASSPRAFPVRIHQLERHPYSAQTFIPLRVSRYLVVVAPSARDGRPDRDNLRAFVAERDQGVCYGRGVWHHGLTVLDEPAEFVTVMSMSSRGDDEFVDLPEVVEIRGPAWSGRPAS